MKKTSNISKLNDLIDLIEVSCSKEKCDELRDLLTKHQTNEDVLDGARLFLEDHNFNVDALIHFLNTDKTIVVISAKSLHHKLIPYYAAASIFAIAIVCYLYFQNYVYHSTIKVYTISDNSLPVFASSTKPNTAKNKMINAYKTGEAELGLQYFNQLQGMNTTIDDTTKYVAALLYLENKEYDDAMGLFEQINKDNLSPKVTYFTSLALLHLGKKEEAKLLLINISKTNDAFLVEQANKILGNDLFFVNP